MRIATDTQRSPDQGCVSVSLGGVRAVRPSTDTCDVGTYLYTVLGVPLVLQRGVTLGLGRCALRLLIVPAANFALCAALTYSALPRKSG